MLESEERKMYKCRRKVLSILLMGVLVITLMAGCGSNATNADDSNAATSENSDSESSTSSNTSAEIALITTAGSGGINDRGFFQSTYEGIQTFCEETGHTYTYYETSDDSEDAFYEAIEMAVLNGAQVICTAGGDFIGMMETVFESYPDITFICNELPYTEAAENAVIYIFKAQEATFLAGIAAVYEGYTDIGVICGKQILPNMRGGYGFMQGVNYAAGELGIEGINLKYWYSNSFETSPDIQSYAAAWYESGTELIAAFCGGSAPSIWAAAESASGFCMGCDIDQYFESDTIITSFLKNVGSTTQDGLKAWEEGTFEGNRIVNVGIAEDGVGLAMENSRMENFTSEIYEDYYNRLLDGEFGELLTAEDAETPNDLWDLIETKNITFTYYE